MMLQKSFILAIALVLSMLGSMTFLGGNAYAFSSSTHETKLPSSSVPSNRMYTILTYDKLGNLLSTWRGPYAQYLQLMQVFRSNRPLVRPTTVPSDQINVPHTSNVANSKVSIAPDINRVDGCSDPNDFWDVRNYPPLICFANAGDATSLNIYQVYEVDSGNNTGYFKYWPGVPYRSDYRVTININDKYSSAQCGNCTWTDVTEVNIY